MNLYLNLCVKIHSFHRTHSEEDMGLDLLEASESKEKICPRLI